MIDNVLVWSRAVLSGTSARWHEITRTLPEELLKQPPAPNQWSALGCLQHLVDAERLVFPPRIKYILAGEDFPAFDPDIQGTKSAVEVPSELAAEFERIRTDGLALLSQIASADLMRQVCHPQLGPVTLSELLHTWAAHDLMHTVAS